MFGGIDLSESADGIKIPHGDVCDSSDSEGDHNLD